MHQPARVDRFERKFVAVKLLAVGRLTASVIAAAACQLTPLLAHCGRIRGTCGSLLVPVHLRGMTHTIYACGAISTSRSHVITISWAVTVTHSLANFCSCGQHSAV